MPTHFLRRPLLAILVAALPVALAACAAPSATPLPPAADPLNPQAGLAELVHRSSLAGQRPTAADKALDWRQANEEVARIGGWRAYAREASAPASSPQTAPAPTPAPAPAPAGGTR